MDPPDLRMHNLSDGFALLGTQSRPNVVASVDQANASLRSVDGQMYFKLNPTTHAIAGFAPGGFDFNGVTIDSSGNVATPGTVQAVGSISSTAGALNAATEISVNDIQFIDSNGTIETPGSISSTTGAVNAKTQVSVNGTALTVP